MLLMPRLDSVECCFGQDSTNWQMATPRSHGRNQRWAKSRTVRSRQMPHGTSPGGLTGEEQVAGARSSVLVVLPPLTPQSCHRQKRRWVCSSGSRNPAADLARMHRYPIAGTKLKPRLDVHLSGDDVSRVARVNSSHPYLENDPSSSLVSHRLRISPWHRFSRSVPVAYNPHSPTRPEICSSASGNFYGVTAARRSLHGPCQPRLGKEEPEI